LSCCIQSGEAFAKIANHVNADELTNEGRIIWSEVEAYYSRDPLAERCDEELLSNAVKRRITNPKHVAMFEQLVNTFSTCEVSVPNVVTDFIETKKEHIGSKLATALSGGKPEEVKELMDLYHEWDTKDDLGEEDPDEVEVGICLDKLSEEYASENLIKMYPKSLNDNLRGGMKRGHNVIVFARPEMGKTMFVVNTMFGMIKQGLTTLYVGNEEPIGDIQCRLLSRLFQVEVETILANKSAWYERAAECGADKVKWKQLSPGTPREIERLCAKHKPDVLIVDQLRNIIPSKGDNFTQQLEGAAKGIRNIAQRHDLLAVNITQAGASADGKGILEMTDVDSSNTGIPAQADLMIGIGATEDDASCNRRVLSLCKNKRGGNHAFFNVGVIPQFSTLKSM